MTPLFISASRYFRRDVSQNKVAPRSVFQTCPRESTQRSSVDGLDECNIVVVGGGLTQVCAELLYVGVNLRAGVSLYLKRRLYFTQGPFRLGFSLRVVSLLNHNVVGRKSLRLPRTDTLAYLLFAYTEGASAERTMLACRTQ